MLWLQRNPGKPPFLHAIRSDQRFITLVVAVAVFTDIFLYGLIVPVFPFSLQIRVGVDPDAVQQWVTVLLAVYGAGLLIAAPISGYMADHTSTRRLPFLLGLIALLGATVMLCIGSSIAVLTVGRLLQGISAAVVWSVGLALLADTVGAQKVGMAMSYVLIATSLGIFLGPLLGGVVYDKGGYYAVFAMAFALLGVDIVLRLMLIEKEVALRVESSTTTEILEMTTAEQERETALNQSQSTPNSQLSDAPGARKKKLRLPPLVTLLASRRFIAALVAAFVQALITTSFDTTLPLFAAETYHFDSTGAGLLFLALIIPSFVSPVIGKISDRYGPRWIMSSGFLLCCPFLILCRIPDSDRVEDIVMLCVFLVFVGFGLATAAVPVMAEFMLCVEEKEREKPGIFGKKGAVAQAYGLFNIAFSAGTLIGPVLSGYLRTATGWGNAMLTLGVFSVITALVTVIFTGGTISKDDIRRTPHSSDVEQQ